MNVPQNLLEIVSNGSIAVIVFVMWYLSFKQFHKQQERVYRQMEEQTGRMFELIEQDIRYKEELTTILSRVETKMDFRLKSEQRG